MGYRDGACYVVTTCIGPGSAALHGRARFQPDCDYQEAEIARIYEESGRQRTYLGNWHSHPGETSPRMSRHDRRVMMQIASYEAARLDQPLMAIVAGSTDMGWRLGGWAPENPLPMVPGLGCSGTEGEAILPMGHNLILHCT